MQTIIIKLDAKKLSNPDLDILYLLPERIEEYTDHTVNDNGYDYLSDSELAIWLSAEDAKNSVITIIELLKAETFCENDLSKTAELYISLEDCAGLEECERVYM